MDPIFFTKDDIAVGVQLTCYGRLTPGSHWTISLIITHERVGRGVYKSKPVKSVQKLDDEVYMKCGSEMRQASFAYLSYSAIWRIKA